MLSLPIAQRPEDREVPLYPGDQDQLNRDIARVSRKRLAELIVGGFSYPSKMPCPAWGIPARRCRIGSVLAQREGTVCSECYAMDNLFRMKNVQVVYERRYQGLFNTDWTPAMIAMVRWYADEYFRFFDSGDLQGINHLLNICAVAKNVRDVLFWLPTREYKVVRACKGGDPRESQGPPVGASDRREAADVVATDVHCRLRSRERHLSRFGPGESLRQLPCVLDG